MTHKEKEAMKSTYVHLNLNLKFYLELQFLNVPK